MFTTRRFRDGMDRKVDDLESRIRRFMETKSGFENIQTQAQVLAQYLMGYDGRRDGCLTFEEFNAAMIGMNFVGTQFEIIALYQRYDVNGDNRLDYNDFASYLYGIIPNPTGTAEYRFSMNKFKDEVKRLDGILGIRALRLMFNCHDKYHDRKLLKDELIRAIRQEGYNLTDLDARVIMKCFDKYSTGFVQLDDFIDGVRGPKKYVRRVLIEEIFDFLDVDKSGKLVLDNLRDKCDITKYPPVEAGKMSPEDGFNHFLYTWDLEEKYVTKDQFLEYYFDIGGLIYDDAHFESIMREFWRYN